MISMRSRAHGFSLVELMIALVAGLIVSSAVVAFLMSSFKTNGDYVISTRLTQDLRNTLDLITRDMRRAGYDEINMTNMASGRNSRFSRFMLCNTTGTCITNTTRPTAAETCAIYAYDRVGGTAGTVDLSNGEVRGIRIKQVPNLNGITVGVIEYAVSSGTTRPLCNAAGPTYSSGYPTTCNTTTNWCPLTDATKLDITSFTLTDKGAVSGGVLIRDIAIVLQGRPAGTTDYTRGVSTQVRIRSDCYLTSLADCTLTP